jgi:hypothetical protein
LSNSNLSAITQKDGSFQIDNLIAPTSIQDYYVKAIYSGNYLYKKIDSNILELQTKIKDKREDNIILTEANNYYSNEIRKKPLTINPMIFNKRDFKINNDLCFVLIPFKPQFERLFKDHISPTLKTRFKEVKKANDIYESSPIIEDIWILINEAQLIIADVTGKNANVFYELGIAHTLGKDVIIITQNKEDIPFDILHIRHIQYNDNEDGWKYLKETLQKFTDTILNKSHPSNS